MKSYGEHKRYQHKLKGDSRPFDQAGKILIKVKEIGKINFYSK